MELRGPATKFHVLNLTSSAFKNEEFIPDKFTCDGRNISPPLRIDSIPAEVKSLALIVDDPGLPREPGFIGLYGTFRLPISFRRTMCRAPREKMILARAITAALVRPGVHTDIFSGYMV